jgi:hypothetical protein
VAELASLAFARRIDARRAFALNGWLLGRGNLLPDLSPEEFVVALYLALGEPSRLREAIAANWARLGLRHFAVMGELESLLRKDGDSVSAQLLSRLKETLSTLKGQGKSFDQASANLAEFLRQAEGTW